VYAPEPYSFGLGRWHPGLGDSSTPMSAQQEASLITGAGNAIQTAITSSSVSGEAGGAVTAAFDVGALFAGPAAPIVAAIGNFLGPLIAKFNGCGQTCVEATQIANSVGTPMTQAFQAYMSADVHYYSAQQTFLNLFNQLMAALQKACSNPALGTAGQNCISDNSPNACHWKTSPGGWINGQFVYWGAAGSGDECWNPYLMYQAVLNDPTVVPDPVTDSASSTTTPATTTTTQPSSSDSTLLLVAVLGLLAAVVFL
jgi:hypothetical protein